MFQQLLALLPSLFPILAKLVPVFWVAVLVLGTFVALSFLYALYIFVMVAKNSWDNMKRSEKVFTFLPAATGLFLDWFVNMTFCTVYFMDWPASPKELVTGRMIRYRLDASLVGTRKRKKADWLCPILNKYAPGHQHC